MRCKITILVRTESLDVYNISNISFSSMKILKILESTCSLTCYTHSLTCSRASPICSTNSPTTCRISPNCFSTSVAIFHSKLAKLFLNLGRKMQVNNVFIFEVQNFPSSIELRSVDVRTGEDLKAKVHNSTKNFHSAESDIDCNFVVL